MKWSLPTLLGLYCLTFFAAAGIVPCEIAALVVSDLGLRENRSPMDDGSGLLVGGHPLGRSGVEPFMGSDLVFSNPVYLHPQIFHIAAVRRPRRYLPVNLQASAQSLYISFT
jgi:hypothetical protein